MLFCEYCEIFKNSFFIEHLVAASSKIRTKSPKSTRFQFELFLTRLDIMGSFYIVTKSCKIRHPQKNICGGVHLYCNSIFKTFKLKKKKKNSLQRHLLNRRNFFAFTVRVLWNCFLNDMVVKNTSLFNFYNKKIVWQFDLRSQVTQDLGDTRLFWDYRFPNLIKNYIKLTSHGIWHYLRSADLSKIFSQLIM